MSAQSRESRVQATIVTYNSAPWLDRCLNALRAQTCPNLSIYLWDNASTDETLDIAASHADALSSFQASPRNIGFSRAHNRMIEACDCEFVLVLNPDAFLAPDYLAILVEALRNDPSVGAATGKLWRWHQSDAANPPQERVLDTTGMFFTPNQRHLDRGAGEPDRGQYGKRDYVFGASGAAAFYRRAMLNEVQAGSGYFDEDFFAFREDADLAWRAQWLGWRCLYVPEATGYHVRRVLPERRSVLPAEINMHSLKNRFLMRVKNMDAGTYARFFIPITARDLLALGYVVLRERTSLRALSLLFRALPRAWAARKAMQRHRCISPAEMRTWFSNCPVSRPVSAPCNR